jgi:acetyl-CoA acetyltransferase
MGGSVFISAVGAAAPTLRVSASDIGAAWGRRGGRAVSAVCAPDEDTLTLAASAAARALAAADIDPATVDGLWWGCTRPPFAEGPSHAVLSSALGLSPQAGGALMSGSPHSGIEALLGAADAIAAGSARVAITVVSDALIPGLGTAFEARCGAGAAAVVLTATDGPAVLAARVTRSHPLLDRYRGDGEQHTRDLYDPRLFREEMFLPFVREVADHLAALDVRAWSIPDPDGRLGTVIAKAVGATTTSSAEIYATLGDTAAAAALLGAVGAFDAIGPVAVVGTGGGRTTGIVIEVNRPVPGAALVAHHLASDARDATYAEVLRARGQLTPSGEIRARCRRNAPAARRKMCGVRHDQHPAVDSSHLHRMRVPEARTGRPCPPRRGAHLRDQPDDARTVRGSAPDCGGRSRRRCARHAPSRRRRPAARHRVGSRPRVASLRPRTRRPGLRLQVQTAIGRNDIVSWNKVAVVGAGLIKMGELFDQSYEEMAAGAFNAAVASVDKGFDAQAVDAAFVATQRGTLWGQEGIGGNTVPTAIGLAGIPCTRIENACPSGSDAFRVGAMAVASGVHDLVLVIGVEKMRDKSTEEGLLSRAAAGHPIYTRGETAPVLFAPFATRHMHEFGTTREMLASVAVKNHHNGALDPYAHFQDEITIEQVLGSPPVCSPLHLLDCCPQTDGAAAVLLAPADRAHEFTDRPVFVAGFGMATDHPYLHEKTSFVGLEATVLASQRAYAMAGVGPRDIDMCEVHDCFTITEILDIEDLGFFEKGKGGIASLDGETSLTGRIPVNTSGGLLAKGHPIGATGIAQLTECWWQLRGDAGGRQVEIRNGFALQHNVGGRGSGVSVVNILTNNPDSA